MDARKLKRMLELKRRIEHAKKGELAIARDELEQAQEQLRAAQHEHKLRLDALAAETELSVVELSERARFVVLASEGVAAARSVVAARDRELAERQEAVVVATREVRTFETLNERAREEQRLLQRGAEQRAADDIASSRWSNPK